ncbi:MAG TPA: hypothetical protein VHZ96_02515 [Frankiaceae bacterium]|jgi:hypothetical protein|nr:hypothetical protein [Frankiaceae bacterium]
MTIEQSSFKRRPLRGALSGLVLGLGVLVLLFIYSAATFTSLLPFILILVAFIVAGVLMGLFGPARGDRGR